jgi:hypothetical protein
VVRRHARPARHPPERRQPDPVADLDRLGEEREVRPRPVVVAVAEIAALADHHVRADAHRGEAVDPDPFAQPDVVAELEEPRVLDGDPRLADEAAADPRPEGAQERRLHP